MDYYYDSSMNPFAVMLQKREQKEEKKKRINEGAWNDFEVDLAQKQLSGWLISAFVNYLEFKIKFY